jgi:hypothetical protein
MRLGHAVRIVPVEPGEALGGYGARTGGAEGVLDPIEMHVLVFCDGVLRFALVVIDVICVNLDLVEQLRSALAEQGITHAWIAATHTHAAPETGCRPGGAATPPGIAARLRAAVDSAARDALADEREVVIGVSRVSSSGVGESRNVPRAEVRPVPVDVLTFREPGGRRRGALVISPIHPTVLAAGNLRASADLAGAIRRAMSERAGGWTVVATGAAGDVSTRTTRREQTMAEAERLAGRLVSDILAGEVIAGDLPAVPVTATAGDGRIRLDSRLATLAPNTDAAAVPGDGAFGSDPWAQRRRTVYEEAVQLVDGFGGHRARQVQVPVDAVDLDGIVMVALAGEPFLGVGERIRAGCDPAAIVIGYANGYVGYLPDRDAPPSYETVVSPVDARSIDVLVETAWRAAGAVGAAGPGRVEEDRG